MNLMPPKANHLPMKYDVLVEYDPKTGHFTGTVVGLPNIIVDARTEAEALQMARKGIQLYVEETRSSVAEQRAASSIRAKVVPVDVE